MTRREFLRGYVVLMAAWLARAPLRRFAALFTADCRDVQEYPLEFDYLRKAPPGYMFGIDPRCLVKFELHDA